MKIPKVKDTIVKKNKGISILLLKGQIPIKTFSGLEIEKNITKTKKHKNNIFDKNCLNIKFT
jgi:hypothetical protein